jgi:hypothetical protein
MHILKKLLKHFKLKTHPFSELLNRYSINLAFIFKNPNEAFIIQELFTPYNFDLAPLYLLVNPPKFIYDPFFLLKLIFVPLPLDHISP